MNPQHLCQTAEHYTPCEYVETARYVLGAIDLDPASNPLANKTIRAHSYYTTEEDGLTLPWLGRVFCNPPGDRTGDLVREFWVKACEHALYGGYDAAVLWLGFSLNQLATLQRCRPLLWGGKTPSPQCFPHVVAAQRVSFWQPYTELIIKETAKSDGCLSVMVDEKSVNAFVTKGMSAKDVACAMIAALAEREIEAHQYGAGIRFPVFAEGASRRVRILEFPAGIKARYAKGGHPAHYNCFILLGGDATQRQRFRRAFGKYGEFVEGAQRAMEPCGAE